MHLSWENQGKEPEQPEPAHSGHVPTTGADSYEKTLPFGDPEPFQRKKAGIVVLPHRFKTPDGAVTDDELTPVVLIEGKVIGWGWISVRRFKEEGGSQGLPLEEEKETRDIRQDI